MPAKSRSQTRLALRLGLGLAVLVSTLWGAGFWDKKEFTQWSVKELERTFVNSPWAKSVTLTGQAAMDAFSGGGGGGRRGGGGGAPGGGGPPGAGVGGGRRGGGGGGGGGGMPTAPSLRLIVRFDEALPVKHAKVKHRMGESTEVPADFQLYLDEEQPYYVVNVENLPQMLARFEEQPEMLATTARLRRKNHEDILPAKVDVVTGRTVSFRYYFTRADPIELADKEVEFYMKLERPAGMAGAAGRGQRQRGGQGQGQRGEGAQGQRGAGGQGQQGGGGQGQRGAGGQGQQGGGAQGRGQGAQGGGRGGAGAAMMVLGKEIKRKFRLKDMVYQGELRL